MAVEQWISYKTRYEAFYDCSIENIVIHNNVNLMANKVSSSIENLKEVNLPDNMKYTFPRIFSIIILKTTS